MTDAYVEGFCKAAELAGVDPEALATGQVKKAGTIDSAIKGITKILSKADRSLAGGIRDGARALNRGGAKTLLKVFPELGRGLSWSKYNRIMSGKGVGTWFTRRLNPEKLNAFQELFTTQRGKSTYYSPLKALAGVGVGAGGLGTAYALANSQGQQDENELLSELVNSAKDKPSFKDFMARFA